MTKNNSFRFKQFTIQQDKAAMKVGTDGILLGAWANVSHCRNILDVGTGTGLIALMLAQRSGAMISAIEIEEKAAEQAIENVEESSWKERVAVHHMSFREFVKDTNDHFDMIVSNPPFFSNSLKPKDAQRKLARHNDSLSFEELISGACRILCENGKLAVILPSEAEEEFIKLAEIKGLFLIRQTKVRPEESKTANRVLLELSNKKTGFKKDCLIIYSDKNVYSNAFVELTRDFYLRF